MTRQEYQGARFYDWRGQKLPSVTTILGNSWPGEVGWRIGYGAKHVAERAVFQHAELARRLDSDDPLDWTLRWLKAAPTERRDAAGSHGTDLHAYLEDRLNGLPAPDTLEPGQLAVEQFLDAYRPEPLLVEAQCYSVSEGYAGTADGFLRIYGKIYCYDLKSANHAAKDHKVRLQLAAYRYADFIGRDDRELGPVPQCDGALVLVVPRDDPRSWQPIEVEAGPHQHAAFLAGLRLWREYTDHKGTDIGEQLLAQLEGVA